LRLRKTNKFIGINLGSTAIHLGGASTRPSWSLSIRKAYHVRWSRFYMTDRYISKSKRRLEVAKVLVISPVALIIYSLILRGNILLKWVGWWFAAIDAIFMSRFFRRFMS
jgi:GT2 family glycosyltransferase